MESQTNHYFGILVSDKFNELEQMVIEKMFKNGKTDNQIQQFLQSDAYAEICMECRRNLVKSLSEGLEEYSHEDDEFEIAEQNSSLEHLHSLWGFGISWMKQYRRKCFDICEGWHWFNEKSHIVIDKRNTFFALHGIQSRAMLVYAEIICLLENGYPGGAKSLLRTLYELWAVAEFLYHDSDEVSIAYIKSEYDKLNNENDHYKWAKVSTRFAEKVEKNEQITINAIVKKAHKTFRERNENLVSNRFLEKLYNSSNAIIHPSAKGVFNRLSYTPKGQESGLIIGRADTGLSEPAINSSGYMHNITLLYLSIFPNAVSGIGQDVLDYILNQKIIPFFMEMENKQKEEYDNLNTHDT